jgi:hypothetical protein
MWPFLHSPSTTLQLLTQRNTILALWLLVSGKQCLAAAAAGKAAAREAAAGLATAFRGVTLHGLQLQQAVTQLPLALIDAMLAMGLEVGTLNAARETLLHAALAQPDCSEELVGLLLQHAQPQLLAVPAGRVGSVLHLAAALPDTEQRLALLQALLEKWVHLYQCPDCSTMVASAAMMYGMLCRMRAASSDTATKQAIS